MATFRKHVAKDGSASFTVRIRIKGAPEVTKTFSRLTDARQWAENTQSAIKERRYFRTRESERRTVSDLIERHRPDIESDPKKVSAGRLTHLDWWDKEVGHLILADLLPANITEARDKLGRENTVRGRRRSLATVNRYLATLSHALSVAVREWGWLPDSPMRNVRKNSEPKGRVRFLDKDEKARLLEACSESANPYLVDIVVLAISTGMRQNEILTLRWKDVDLQRGHITLHDTKNGDRRGVPLTGHALGLLRNRDKVRRIDSPYLFPGNDRKRPAVIRKAWDTVVKKSKLTDFHFHDLRHTAASYLAMSGASPIEIAEVLGHKTLDMVKRYSHLAEGHTAKVVERMNEEIFGGGHGQKN